MWALQYTTFFQYSCLSPKMNINWISSFNKFTEMTVVLQINFFSGCQYLVDVLIIQTYDFPELNVSKDERSFTQECLNQLKYYHIIWLLVLLSLTALCFNVWRVWTWLSLLIGKITPRFIWKYSEFFGAGPICANIWVLPYVIETQIPSQTSQKKRISKWENLGFFQVCLVDFDYMC